MNNRGASRYFTAEEARETLDPSRKYSRNKETRAYTFKSGAIYEGEWLGGFRHGKGIQKWVDGAQYEGEWAEGKAHGKGTFTHTDGDMYTGNWANDKANGHGKYSH